MIISEVHAIKTILW